MDENLDFSKILDDLGQMLSGEEGQAQLQSVINMLSGSEGQPDGSQSSSSAPDFSAPAGGIDFDTIMRIAQVMQAINSQQDNSKSAFLSAIIAEKRRICNSKKHPSHEIKHEKGEITIKISSLRRPGSRPCNPAGRKQRLPAGWAYTDRCACP